MATQFIGLTMLVTLSEPVGAQLRGTVSSVEPGKSLTLRHVTNPKNGAYLPEWTINAAEIVELAEAGEMPAAAPPPPPPAPTAVPAKKQQFEDPAILSMSRKPQSNGRSSVGEATMSRTASRSASIRAAAAAVETAARDIAADELPKMLARSKLQSETDPNLQSEAPSGLEPVYGPGKPKKASRTQRKKQTRKNEPAIPDLETTPAKETTKSKGWRQTPLLEPNPSFQPFSTLKRQKGKSMGRNEENGWATEDATDVQDMGDFDFAGSLAKFDKQTVFDQLQAEDGIAEEDRLVSHNRLPKFKPGTSRGKNLHHTENVLDTPNGISKKEAWESEDETEEDAIQRDTGSGRQSRRAESRLATSRKPVSRKSSSAKGSINPSRPVALTAHSSKPSFFLVPSDRKCEPISALQMLNLENIADNELGLSEDMMTENAGRGISEVTLSALHPGGRGLVQKSSTTPTVVVLAGNNKSGLRAVAAGRHLRNHGLNVIICVLGLERETELLVGLRRQLRVFRGFGGKLVTKNELLELVKALPLPVDLIIDGLLGLTMPFEELRIGDQATAYELIEWANRSTASVLAIDIPTGIDPTSGKVSIIDGRQLHIHSKYIVAMGAPQKGLLEAMALGEGVTNEDIIGKGKEWQLFVADIGLGVAVWKKAGTKVRRGVEFEGSWVLKMRFQAGSD
ncbi:DFDF domain-containing protein [Phlyctema vagabunda]|uniref:Enhancer of mRNA-decapping protein 3 n=1 Tax=Phlyctema vagabunda TaxID=108571 RepID=A0ABR4PIU2_9HELO